MKNRTIKSDKEVGQKIGQKIGQRNRTKEVGQKIGQKKYCLVGIKNYNGVGLGHKKKRARARFLFRPLLPSACYAG